MYHPEYRGKPLAVLGDPEARHGIVLAKNYEAKAYGVQTGDPMWMAKKKCPDIVFVPPHYDLYMKHSKLIREIYSEYTDQVEESVKHRRLKSLYSAQQKLSLEFNRRRIGKTERVLVEYIDSGLAYCRSYAESPELDGYIIVKDTGAALRAGDFAEVVLRSAEEYDIWGELTR